MRPRIKTQNRMRGFTLVELLVVIAIIGVLVALLLPAVQAAREAARRSQCGNNLRQISIGLHNYHTSHKTFPPGCIERRSPPSTTEKQISWIVLLLPHIEQVALHDSFDMTKPFDAAENAPAASQVLNVVLCPTTAYLASDRLLKKTDDGLGAADYGGIYGAQWIAPTGNGMMIFDQGISIAEVRDGTSNTIIVAEDTGRGTAMDGQWANGENIFDQGKKINDQHHNEMWSDHSSGVNVALADSSVRFLQTSIDSDTLEALCTRAGGEVVDGSKF